MRTYENSDIVLFKHGTRVPKTVARSFVVYEKFVTHPLVPWGAHSLISANRNAAPDAKPLFIVRVKPRATSLIRATVSAQAIEAIQTEEREARRQLAATLANATRGRERSN